MVVLFFNTIPKLKWYFLKRLLQFEIWKPINELLYSVPLKSIMVIAHWLLTSKNYQTEKQSFLSYTTCFPHMFFLISVWFHNIMHLPFGNYWFTELCQTAKCWYIFLYCSRKSRSFISLPTLRIKVFRQWGVVRFIVADVFQNSNSVLISVTDPRGKCWEQWCMNIRPTLSLQVSDQKCQTQISHQWALSTMTLT